MATLSTAKRPSEAPASGVTVLRTPAEDAIVRRAQMGEKASAWGGAGVARLRATAVAALERQGLPSRRVEEWKYTDLRALLREFAEPVTGRPDDQAIAAARALAATVAVNGAGRLEFVDGILIGEAAVAGVEVTRLAQAGAAALPAALGSDFFRSGDRAAHAAVALNSAFMADWIVLRVPAGHVAEQAVHLDFRSAGQTPRASFPRVSIVVEAGASISVIETHLSGAGVAHQAVPVVEIAIAAGASAEHMRINAAGDHTMMLPVLLAELGDEARLSSLSFTTGAAVTRNQVFAGITGVNANASIRGATLLRGKQHCDNTLVVEHAKSGGLSREVFKTVLDDESRGVFQGKIIVQPHAQKTDGKMAAHALLLSEDAEADAKPELEIFADDVVCGHGATAGALNEDLLFYLRARGIPAKQAEALLVQAFVGEAIEPVTDDILRDALMAIVEQWLQARS